MMHVFDGIRPQRRVNGMHRCATIMGVTSPSRIQFVGRGEFESMVIETMLGRPPGPCNLHAGPFFWLDCFDSLDLSFPFRLFRS